MDTDSNLDEEIENVLKSSLPKTEVQDKKEEKTKTQEELEEEYDNKIEDIVFGEEDGS